MSVTGNQFSGGEARAGDTYFNVCALADGLGSTVQNLRPA